MDEFLDDYEVIAGKMRPVLPGSAIDKLDAVRKGLGAAVIRDSAEDSGQEDDDILMPLDLDEKKDRWDCETILSMSVPCRSLGQHLTITPQLRSVTLRITHGLSKRATASLYRRSDSTPRPDSLPLWRISRRASNHSLILLARTTKTILDVCHPPLA